jgi:hypothetical protein
MKISFVLYILVSAVNAAYLPFIKDYLLFESAQLYTLIDTAYLYTLAVLPIIGALSWGLIAFAFNKFSPFTHGLRVYWTELQ